MSDPANSPAAAADLAAWCTTYRDIALNLAEGFIVLALFVALVETALILWAKVEAARKVPAVAQNAATALVIPAVDPIKLLDALKGVLDSVKNLPAWIAIFLAGLALLWLGGQKPDYCTQTDASPSANQAAGNHAVSPASNMSRPAAEGSNGQAPVTTNDAH